MLFTKTKSSEHIRLVSCHKEKDHLNVSDFQNCISQGFFEVSIKIKAIMIDLDFIDKTH